jgi:hypothetical protein
MNDVVETKEAQASTAELPTNRVLIVRLAADFTRIFLSRALFVGQGARDHL